MKKVILFAAILFAGVSSIQAQGAKEGTGKSGANNSDETTLTVNLQPISSIEVEGAVILNYVYSGDYESGVTSLMDDHLTVYSTGNFQVNVSAKEEFEGPDGIVTVGTINVAANKKDANDASASVVLATGDGNNLIPITEGGFGLKYDVTYTGGKDYLAALAAANKIVGGTRTYTATVLYTLLPQ